MCGVHSNAQCDMVGHGHHLPIPVHVTDRHVTAWMVDVTLPVVRLASQLDLPAALVAPGAGCVSGVCLFFLVSAPSHILFVVCMALFCCRAHTNEFT